MKCMICKQGETVPGSVTVTLERGGAMLMVKNVPALVCAICGEAYLDESHTARLLTSVEAAARAGVQVEVREYVAA
jgi:YgiT-type zinc finger domain-containing protein